MDLFKKTMVVCAAIGLFGVGAQTVVSGVDSNLTSKINAVQAAQKAVSVKVDEAVKDVNNP